MPIDNCTHTFEQLVAAVLPGHFRRLEESIRTPLAAELLVAHKSATKDALRKLSREVDFPGCYVFIDSGAPIYVGISRGVVKRLVKYLNTNSHYSASLVYRMATEDYPHEMKRDQAMKDDQFRRVFVAAQERLRSLQFAFVEISNDSELYLFEVYAAMKFDTDTWNTFRTH